VCRLPEAPASIGMPESVAGRRFNSARRSCVPTSASSTTDQRASCTAATSTL